MQRIPDHYIDPLTGLTDPQGFALYLGQFQADLLAHVPPQFLATPTGAPAAHYYLRPPAAGPDLDFIIQLAQNFNAVVETLDAYLGLGAGLIGFLNKRRERDEEAGIYERHKPYMPVQMIEAMCLHHAHTKYYDPQRHPRITVSSYVRPWYAGQVDHPLDYTQYVVTVAIGQVRYVYVVRGTCDVVEHFQVELDAMIGLENPQFHGEFSYYSDGSIAQLEARVFDEPDVKRDRMPDQVDPRKGDS
jgi:hypothetical protein